MLRNRQARALRIPPIFYLYVVALLAMAAFALSRIDHI
jgi:hypothetical protein